MILDIFSDTKKPYTLDRNTAESAEQIKFELKNAYNRFNEATDPLLIEAIIYRMNELETQYRLLLRNAKLERLCGKLICNGNLK